MASVQTFFWQILDEPPVFCVTSGFHLETGFSLCVKEAGGKPFYVLVTAYWAVPDIASDLETFAARANAKYREANIIFLCPTESDTALLRDLGLSALHVHHNAFIDETIYRPKLDVKKQFSAIHIASLHPFKRHHLAWGIRNIAVVTFEPPGVKAVVETLAGYKDLAFCNLSLDSKFRWVPGRKVRDLICRSHCGLILSELEGGNFASGEYLLCGIPVITTPSRGGRHEFFDSPYVTEVPPEPAAIESAVEAAARLGYDPMEIRGVFLRKVLEHRLRLVNWLAAISGRNILAEANANGWIPSFRDKLRKLMSIGEEDLVRL